MPKKKQHTMPRGQAGQLTFEAVQKLIEGGAMSRKQAFAQVAKETGRSPGTVSVSFYTHARKNGVKLRARRRKSGAAKRNGAARSSGVGNVRGILRQLGEVFEKQQQEIGRLQGEITLLGRLREMLHK